MPRSPGTETRGTASPEWDGLGRRVEGCTACPLHTTRLHTVLYRGAVRPTVLFIGEAPGAEEDRAGLPFVGRAGRRLEAAIGELGLPPDRWGVVNLIKCRPPRNRFPPASAERCRPFLDAQLRLLDPAWVVPLGRHALHALDPTAPPISEASGRERPYDGRRLLPLLHPAAALHDPRRRARWASDLQALRRLLADGSKTL